MFFFGSVTESLPRQVPHLLQCSYGLAIYLPTSWFSLLLISSCHEMAIKS